MKKANAKITDAIRSGKPPPAGSMMRLVVDDG
jgi:hypothetical protein